MKKAWLVIGVLLMSSHSKANIVCETGTRQNQNRIKITLDTSKNAVLVQSDSLSKPKIHTRLSQFWDGHMTGLIVGPEFSMTYQNKFGCIRNVIVTTNIRDTGVDLLKTFHIRSCNGEIPASVCN